MKIEEIDAVMNRLFARPQKPLGLTLSELRKMWREYLSSGSTDLFRFWLKNKMGEYENR